MRLEPGLRFWNYAVWATLSATGVTWLVADMLKTSADEELWQAIAANMLMLHGITAMIALVLLGAGQRPSHPTLTPQAGRGCRELAARTAASNSSPKIASVLPTRP